MSVVDYAHNFSVQKSSENRVRYLSRYHYLIISHHIFSHYYLRMCVCLLYLYVCLSVCVLDNK